MRASLALSFPPTTGNQVQTLIDGAQVYPRILEDLRAASSSIKIIQFGFKECKIGRSVADILMAKARAGIDVEVCVSNLGSKVHSGSKKLYLDMSAAGVKVVINEGLLPIRMRGLEGGHKHPVLNTDELCTFEHRKIIAVDSEVSYVGGMGFEDHFVDKMHDVMIRLSGPCAKQLETLCDKSFDFYLGQSSERKAQPIKLENNANLGRVTVLHNAPKFHWFKINDALFRAIDNAQKEIWVMNPYLGDYDIRKKLCAAARRGVAVRTIFAGQPENRFAKGKQRAQYKELLAAGVEIYQYPTLLHTKAALFDDKEVIVGSMNLDSLSTSRNFEVVVRLEDPKDIAFYKRELFLKDLQRCTRKEKRGNNVFAHAVDAICGRIDGWMHA